MPATVLPNSTALVMTATAKAASLVATETVSVAYMMQSFSGAVCVVDGRTVGTHATAFERIATSRRNRGVNCSAAFVAI
jgi:hypothetical protein